MTVGELIEKLRTFPATATVTYRDEVWLTDIDTVEAGSRNKDGMWAEEFGSEDPPLEAVIVIS